MIPHKVFLPVAGALATLAVALTTLLVPVPLGWAVPATVALTLLVIAVSEQLVHVTDSLLKLTIDAKTLAFRLVAAAIVANGAVAVTLEVSGLGAVPQVLLALVILAAAQMIIARGADAYLSRVRPRLKRAEWERRERDRESRVVETTRDREAEVLRQVPGVSPDVVESHDVLIMRRALVKVKLSWLVIKDRRHLSDARGLFGIQFDVQITAEAMSHKNRRTLPPEAAEPIAVALSELLNQIIETRWVGIQRLPRAGGYLVTVTVEDVMARLYEFEDELEWADIRQPALIGFGLDAKPIRLLLRQHGQFLGKTRSGKSSLINCALAYLTRCRNAVVWVCGTEKLYDMLAGWLEVYLGEDEPMPINWVMAGPQDTAEMLAALMRVARYRQSLRLSQRQGLPDIVCVLDEASFALRNTTITATFDNRELTMSALAGMIAQGAGSAGCWLDYATQRDTNDQLGPAGGDLQAQTGFTAAFGTQDNLSLGRQLGDFKLPPPVHKGEFYLKDDAGEQPYPVLIKGRYLQEEDPSKPHLHDGLTVGQVSWSRRAFHVELDEGSQRAAGDVYLARPTRVTERFLDYLANPTAVTAPTNYAGLGSLRPRPELDPVEASAADLAGRMGLEFGSLSPAQREAYLEVARELHEADAPALALTPADPPRSPGVSLTEQVTWALRQAARPLSMRDILDAMRAAGLEIRSEGSVRNLLGKLVDDGVLTRGADKLYSLVDGN